MKLSTVLHGVNEEGEITNGSREISIEIFESSLVLDLGRPGGFANDDDAPRIWVEWGPDKGWYVIVHNNNGDPIGRAILNDDGTFVIKED